MSDTSTKDINTKLKPNDKTNDEKKREYWELTDEQRQQLEQNMMAMEDINILNLNRGPP